MSYKGWLVNSWLKVGGDDLYSCRYMHVESNFGPYFEDDSDWRKQESMRTVAQE